MKRTDLKNEWGLKYGMVPYLSDYADADKLTENGKWRASVKGEKVVQNSETLTVNGVWISTGFIGHTIGHDALAKLTIRFPYSTPLPTFYGTDDFWKEEKQAFGNGYEIEYSDNCPEGWLDWVTVVKKPRWNKPWITRYRVKPCISEKDRTINKSFLEYEEAQNRLPATQPQAKGEERWRMVQHFGNSYINIYSRDGKIENLGQIESEERALEIVEGMNLLAGHDLAKVAVVDRELLVKIERWFGQALRQWNHLYDETNHEDDVYLMDAKHEEGNLYRLALKTHKALAKLNAGESHD